MYSVTLSEVPACIGQENALVLTQKRAIIIDLFGLRFFISFTITRGTINFRFVHSPGYLKTAKKNVSYEGRSRCVPLFKGVAEGRGIFIKEKFCFHKLIPLLSPFLLHFVRNDKGDDRFYFISFSRLDVTSRKLCSKPKALSLCPPFCFTLFAMTRGTITFPFFVVTLLSEIPDLQKPEPKEKTI